MRACPTHVALLRGINVGGRNRVAMADLREVVTSLEHTEVTTYVQSGNVVFTSPDADPGALVAALEQRIGERRTPSACTRCSEAPSSVPTRPAPTRPRSSAPRSWVARTRRAWSGARCSCVPRTGSVAASWPPSWLGPERTRPRATGPPSPSCWPCSTPDVPVTGAHRSVDDERQAHHGFEGRGHRVQGHRPRPVSHHSIHHHAAPALKPTHGGLGLWSEVSITGPGCRPAVGCPVGQDPLQRRHDIPRTSCAQLRHGATVGQGGPRGGPDDAVNRQALCPLEQTDGSVGPRSEHAVNNQAEVRGTTECPLEPAHGRSGRTCAQRRLNDVRHGDPFRGGVL